jgi:hypothetical protein
VAAPGYWQQRADYTIAATLDEARQVLSARGTLHYVNHSRDTLRELRVHQYLNAFRPGSRWSAVDAREGRRRFGHLGADDIGYERFTAPPRVGDRELPVRYPLSPDSTVAVIALATPLAPGDSVDVELAWDARPSTTPRRQGRRDRHWDLAQWYPKVAVYDAGGWQDRPLTPAGELYGEFGSFDVTLVVRDDQVLGATGVPVEGDPGWTKHPKSTPAPPLARDAYAVRDPGPAVTVPPGYKRVRWVAREVHHFAWSTSPDYVHEGRAWVRRRTPDRALPFVPFDTVAIHVLWRTGDEAEWGRGVAVERTAKALEWLEQLYGAYPYPQITNLHRLDGGGTEFPMVIMDGSADYGLILHELGHVYTYGILANNEWRDGWLDEGLTSFQESWAQGLLPQEQAGRALPATRAPGYRGLGLEPAPLKRFDAEQAALDLLGRAEPLRTEAAAYREFGIYNQMIYGRGERMYRALRDVMSEAAFAELWRAYYARWALKHVNEAALRTEAERACGCDLGWFFDQWIRRTGLVDYGLGRVSSTAVPGGVRTTVQLRRVGEYLHTPSVGLRTSLGWQLVRAPLDTTRQWQTLEITTSEQPLEVRLDPVGASGDWNPANDTPRRWYGHAPNRATNRDVLDWPLLDQWTPDARVTAWSLLPWYTTPGGASGALRARLRTGEFTDLHDIGIGLTARVPGVATDARAVRGTRFPFWWTWRNPSVGRNRRPVMGLALELWDIDGLARAAVSRQWDRSPFLYANGPRRSVTIGADVLAPNGSAWLSDGRWSGRTSAELQVRTESATPSRARRVAVALGVAGRGGNANAMAGAFARAEFTQTLRATGRGESWYAAWRGYAGAVVGRAPIERQLLVSAANGLETFAQHWWRGAGAPLARRATAYAPLGGAGVRGYAPSVSLGTDVAAVAANLEWGLRLATVEAGVRPTRVFAALWADAGGGSGTRSRASAGLGLVLRGTLVDEPIRVRVDVPLYVSDAASSIGPVEWTTSATRFRLTFSFTDLW